MKISGLILWYIVLMLSSAIATLSPEDFKRRFWVHRSTFEKMVEALQASWRIKPKPGVG